jgi:preprotein translocase subunit SecB
MRLSEDGLELDLQLRATIVVRVAEREVWDARVELVGRFTSDKPLKDIDAAYFARTSGLYVLWPFARTALDNLSRMAGVSAPILPLLVRPATVPSRS